MLQDDHEQLWGSTHEQISSLISSAVLYLEGRTCLCGFFRLFLPYVQYSWSPLREGSVHSRDAQVVQKAHKLLTSLCMDDRGKVKEQSEKVSSSVLGVLFSIIQYLVSCFLGLPRRMIQKDYLYKGDCKPLISERDVKVWYSFCLQMQIFISVLKNYRLHLKILCRFSSAS